MRILVSWVGYGVAMYGQKDGVCRMALSQRWETRAKSYSRLKCWTIGWLGIQSDVEDVDEELEW